MTAPRRTCDGFQEAARSAIEADDARARLARLRDRIGGAADA
jgi:hypothetical protein